MENLSTELKCKILAYLCTRDVCRITQLSRSWRDAVDCYRLLCTHLNFCENKPEGTMTAYMTDELLQTICCKHPAVERVYGFHPPLVYKRAQNFPEALSIPGVIKAFLMMKCLKRVDISDIHLLTALSKSLPKVSAGMFRNRNSESPPLQFPVYQLSATSNITMLELSGVTLDRLVSIATVRYLHLLHVCFTSLDPFASTSYPRLKSFMLADCIGEGLKSPLNFISLGHCLSDARSLEVLHLTGTCMMGNIFRHIIDREWRTLDPFCGLRKIVLSANPNINEFDIGLLLLASQASLDKLFIQKSLTNTAVMLALSRSQPVFRYLETVYLGYVERNFIGAGKSVTLLSNEEMGTTDQRPCQLTDSCMRTASVMFSSDHFNSLSINECPYLYNALSWIPEQPDVFDTSIWKLITELTLSNCITLHLTEFCEFLELLPRLRMLTLVKMFYSPPKGCSSVGLTAGISFSRMPLSQVNLPVQPLPVPISQNLCEQQIPGAVRTAYSSPARPSEEPVRHEESVVYRRDQAHFGSCVTPELIEQDLLQAVCTPATTVRRSQRIQSNRGLTAAPPGFKSGSSLTTNGCDLSKHRVPVKPFNMYQLLGEARGHDQGHIPYVTFDCCTGNLSCATYADSRNTVPLTCCQMLNLNHMAFRSDTEYGVKRHRIGDVCHKSVGTSDPFIEVDIVQWLYIPGRHFECLNMQETGISHIGLEACYGLDALTVNACPLLKAVKFSIARCRVPRRYVRVTKCPKLSPVQLLQGLTLCRSHQNHSVRCIEIELMQDCDRRDLLIALADACCPFKCLVEVQHSAADARSRVMFEDILQNLTLDNQRPYEPGNSSLFRTYIDKDIHGTPCLISHNLRGAVQITNHHQSPENLMRDRTTEDQPPEGILLCFVYCHESILDR